MEKLEIVIVILVLSAIIALNVIRYSRRKHGIPISPNPPPPPRPFIERNPYLCSKKRIEAINSIAAIKSLTPPVYRIYFECVEAEIKLIRKAQLEIDETKD